MSRHAIEVEQVSKHVFENIPNIIPMWASLLKFSFIFFFLLQELWNKLILNDFGDVLRRYKTAFREEEKMTIAMFYDDIKLILRRENDFGDGLQRYKTDFREEKMTVAMFCGDINLILPMFYSDLK